MRNYVVFGTAICALPASAWAQTAPRDMSGHDIVVTATKREQTLQEVPLSVGVVSGETIADQGMRMFTDLSSTVPNLQIDNTNGNFAITIRGLGSGAQNLAFEQSVGLFVDGVYSGRARSLQVPFLDVARVEVVRGPQGALFGKNTNAGAISIVTKRPTRDFELEVRAGAELAVGGLNTSVVASGPMSSTLSARLSGQIGYADGYIKNRMTGQDDNSVQYISGRAQLLWEPSPDFEALLKVEAFRNDIEGSNGMFNQIGAPGCALCDIVRDASGGANAQERPGFWRTSRGTPIEDDKTRSMTASLNLQWTLGDWNISSITAYQDLSSARNANTIPGGLPMLNILQAEDTWQFSQELRASGQLSDAITLTGGINYTKADTDILQRAFWTGDATGLAFLPEGIADRPFSQRTETWSPYLIAEIDLTDRLGFSGSLRYSHETKDARAISIYYGPRRPANNIDYDLTGRRKERLWDYSLRLAYELSPEANFYVSYATGTKGGGFISNDGLLYYNILNNGASFSYEDERARSWEVGAKLRLLDRRLDVDMAVFRTDFTNLQVSSYNGYAFITGNAAEARSQGVELDIRFRPTPLFSLGATGAYLNAEYLDYPGGPCIYNAPAGCAAPTNNLAGVQLTRAPKWKGSTFLQFDVPVGDLTLTARGSADYTSRSYLQGDMDPLNSMPGYTRYDARLALRSGNDRWELALVGRNLSNEVIISQAFYTPVLGTTSHTVMVNPPRTVSIEATFRY